MRAKAQYSAGGRCVECDGVAGVGPVRLRVGLHHVLRPHGGVLRADNRVLCAYDDVLCAVDLLDLRAYYAPSSSEPRASSCATLLCTVVVFDLRMRRTRRTMHRPRMRRTTPHRMRRTTCRPMRRIMRRAAYVAYAGVAGRSSTARRGSTWRASPCETSCGPLRPSSPTQQRRFQNQNRTPAISAFQCAQADVGVFVAGVGLDAVKHHAGGRAEAEQFGVAERAPVDRRRNDPRFSRKNVGRVGEIEAEVRAAASRPANSCPARCGTRPNRSGRNDRPDCSRRSEVGRGRRWRFSSRWLNEAASPNRDAVSTSKWPPITLSSRSNVSMYSASSRTAHGLVFVAMSRG